MTDLSSTVAKAARLPRKVVDEQLRAFSVRRELNAEQADREGNRVLPSEPSSAISNTAPALLKGAVEALGATQ